MINSVYREKFPKAVKHMETKLQARVSAALMFLYVQCRDVITAVSVPNQPDVIVSCCSVPRFDRGAAY